MSSLSLVEAKLPAGFRFHPRDDELICDYSMKWVSIGGGSGGAPAGHGQPPSLIEVDLNKCDPWDIPAKACVAGKDWYFYSQRDKKYATGLRTNRVTVSGYWKATGKDRRVLRKGTLVGMRKTLVFYEGRAPKGRKTSWVMHEFRLEGPLAPPKSTSNSIVVDWVICKVFNKNKTEVCAKQGLGSNIYHETITANSWSLPPLMEPYNNINTRLDQIDHDQNERVSSFSINFTPNPNTSSLISHVDDHDLSNIFPNPLGGQIISKLYNPSDYYDKKVVTHVLKHVCTSGSGSGSATFGEGSSAESYLSHEVSFNQPYSIWN